MSLIWFSRCQTEHKALLPRDLYNKKHTVYRQIHRMDSNAASVAADGVKTPGLHSGSGPSCENWFSVRYTGLRSGDLVAQWTQQWIGNRAFSVTTPRAWNRLPTELKLFCGRPLLSVINWKEEQMTLRNVYQTNYHKCRSPKSFSSRISGERQPTGQPANLNSPKKAVIQT